RTCTQRKSTWAGRTVHRAIRRRRAVGSYTRCRRILPLGQAVYLVVEQHDLAIQVTPQQVHRMVAANGKRIAVAGDDPYIEIGIGQLCTGRDRGRAAMDRVEPVCFHIIWETRGTADAADEDSIFGAHTQFRHGPLHRFQDSIVTATGAPTHFLIGFPVFDGRDFCHLVHDRFSSIAASISAMVKGCPDILFTGLASTRYWS